MTVVPSVLRTDDHRSDDTDPRDRVAGATPVSGVETHTRRATTSSTATTAHLSEADVEDLGAELDALRESVMNDLGDEDARYIRRVIATQRGLETGGRVLLLASLLPPAWIGGTAALAVSKILENMEIGHNVLHGQWDWMNDPEIHSSTWEWDSASSAQGWKYTHNYIHHTYTNVLGKDRDIGYAVLRVGPDQPWRPHHLLQLGTNAILSLGFEYGIAIYDIELEEVAAGRKPWSQARGEAEVFTEDQLDGETRGQWYLRQMLGSANLDGSPLTHLMTGNLSHQIEHHLFPDMPSRRYAQVAPAVRDICARYGLPYTSGTLPRQYLNVLSTIARMSLP